MSDKDRPGYKAFLGNRAKTIGAPVADCLTGMLQNELFEEKEI